MRTGLVEMCENPDGTKVSPLFWLLAKNQRTLIADLLKIRGDFCAKELIDISKNSIYPVISSRRFHRAFSEVNLSTNLSGHIS